MFKGGRVQHGDASLIIEVLYGRVVALLLAWSEEVRPACHIDLQVVFTGTLNTVAKKWEHPWHPADDWTQTV